MTVTTLETFANAWRRARSVDRPPTIAGLREEGAPVSHSGYALLGRVGAPPQNSFSMFRFIEAGEDHERLGGGIQPGHHLDTLIHPAALKRILELYEEIASGQKTHRWRCTNMARNAPPISYSRILAPIHDDQGDGRCLAGIWIWHDQD